MFIHTEDVLIHNILSTYLNKKGELFSRRCNNLMLIPYRRFGNHQVERKRWTEKKKIPNLFLQSSFGDFAWVKLGHIYVDHHWLGVWCSKIVSDLCSWSLPVGLNKNMDNILNWKIHRNFLIDLQKNGKY